MLQRVASGSLRLVMEGVSSKKGPKPDWLESAVDFQLTGISEGSTNLTIEAAILEDVIADFQIPIFERNPESLKPYTGVDLALEAFGQAFQSNEDDDLLDKHLLKEMEKYSTLFRNKKGTVKISGYQVKKPVQFSYSHFEEIKELEERTPPPIKALITGQLDLMQYSKELIKVDTKAGNVRAILSGELTFEEVGKFFGKEVTLEGIAHFKPSKKVSSIEVEKIHSATAQDQWFSAQPTAITEQINFADLSKEQEYHGTALDNVIGQWPGDESIEELLALLNK